MAHWKSLGSATAIAVGVFALANSSSAQYVVDSAKLPSGPGINSRSENIDFGDIDLDGDWDIAVADGGDGGNDQNRAWINFGGLQGGTLVSTKTRQRRASPCCSTPAEGTPLYSGHHYIADQLHNGHLYIADSFI